MSTHDLQSYIDHCAQTTRDYKHLHRQHLTVFAAFQKLQRASKDLVRCTRSIQSQLGEQNTDELNEMFEEQQRIANELMQMDSESYHPNIHDDSDLVQKVRSYLENTQHPLRFRSFYGTDSLENIDVPYMNKPFKHMLSQLVTKLKWYDYLFHHLIPGMFEFDELVQLSAFKSNPYYPCIVIDCEQNKAFQSFVQKLDEHEHGPHLRVKIDHPSYLNHYEYYCPVIDDGPRMLLHHARSAVATSYLSSTDSDQLKKETSLSLTLFNEDTFETLGSFEIAPKKMHTLHDGTADHLVNTFKEHAFSLRTSGVYDGTRHADMAKTCVTEYSEMMETVNQIWAEGCQRLRIAIHASDDVKEFIRENSTYTEHAHI